MPPDVFFVGDEQREVPWLRADRHEARAVEAVAVRPGGGEHDGVQADGEGLPFRKNREERADVANEQDVAVAGAGMLAVDLRVGPRGIVAGRG